MTSSVRRNAAEHIQRCQRGFAHSDMTHTLRIFDMVKHPSPRVSPSKSPAETAADASGVCGGGGSRLHVHVLFFMFVFCSHVQT